MRTPSFYRIASRQFWFFFTLIFLLVGAGLLVAGGVLLQQEQRYSTDGAEATGRVVDKYTRRSSGRSRSTRYIVLYEFDTPDGFHISGQDSIGSGRWNSLRRGDSVPVEYVKSQPEKNRVAGESEYTVSLVLSGIGGGVALVAGFFFWKSLGRVRTALRLWREGVRTEGAVAEVKATNVRINRVTQWMIHYTYHDYGGRQQRGKSDYLPPDEAQAWKAGDTGVVRYDQNRPELSVWVGREESY